MLPDLDRAVERLRLRAARAAWLAELARQLAPALFVAGALALALRFAWDYPRARAAWCALALALVPLTAWLSARRRFLSRGGAAAWLDLASGGSGLLVTELATSDERWRSVARERLALAGEPRHARWMRPFASSLPGIAFLAGALWLEPPTSPGAPSTRVVETTLERAQEKLATLEEQVELEPELAQELRARLERIEGELAEARPETTFEATDRLSERIEEQARKSLEDARRAEDSLGLAADASASAEAARDALEKALAAMQQGGLANQLPPSLASRLEPGSLKLPAGLKLDPKELAQLSSEMRAGLEARLGALAKAGLLTQRELERAGRLGTLDDFPQHVCDETCKRGGT